MNLSTPRLEKRAKEVDIRKSVGSNKYHFVIQFLAESMVFSFSVYIIAIMLAQLVLPRYNNMVDKD